MTIAVGFFDGVHLGHQAILKGADLALTFENHPLSLLAPERAPRLIMSWEDRAKAIRSLGVKVTALAFDADLAGYSPERFLAFLQDFAADQGWNRMDPLTVRCGANWRFGQGGVGDAAWLRAHGVDVTVVPYAEFKGEPISSTRIRRALEAGEIADAHAMMGRPYAIRGEIIPGKGLGRTLGYPTLNVRPDSPSSQTPPQLPHGVYAVEADGVRAVANYGLAPTMGAQSWKEPIWELHVLGCTNVRVVERAHERTPFVFEVLRFLRPERTFASIEELKIQIAKDCEEAVR